MSNGLDPGLIQERELPYLPAALSSDGERPPVSEIPSLQMFEFQCARVSKTVLEWRGLVVKEGPETKYRTQEELLEREDWFWPFEYLPFLKSKSHF